MRPPCPTTPAKELVAKGYARRTRDRSGYLTPVGKLPSVTTIVGATKSEEAKAALQRWRDRMENETEGIKKAAANRGTWTHTQAETWILNAGDLPATPRRPTCTDLPGMAQQLAWGGYWQSLKGWLEANFHSALALEKPIWHPAGFSGTFDCLGWLYDSTDLVLLDWKTRGGKPLPPNGEILRGYQVQLAAYRAGIAWTYGVEVDQAQLVIARPSEEPQVVVINRQLLDDCEEEFFDRLRRYQAHQQQQQQEGALVLA